MVRIAVSFGAVLSAYLVYALVAVRLIEPSVSRRAANDSQSARL